MKKNVRRSTMRNFRDVFIGNEQDDIYISFALKRLIKKIVDITLEINCLRNEYEVSVTFTNNEKIKNLNREYRNADKITDVLSFPMNDGGEILGDIIISAEKAKEQAAEYGNSFEREAAFLCVHGMLHLLGYDHEISKKEEKIMFDTQKLIMDLIGLK